MATPCLRKCVETINRLLSEGEIVVIAHGENEGRRIVSAVPLMISPDDEEITLRFFVEGGGKAAIKVGYRKEEANGTIWIVPEVVKVAWYSERGKTFWGKPKSRKREISALPKAYTADNYVQLPDPSKKKSQYVQCHVSGDFNGGIFLDGYQLEGYSCANHPPPGYRLYSSWSTIGGTMPPLMTYLLEKINPESKKEVASKGANG